MGTSAKNRGSTSSNPLVPSWLDGDTSNPEMPSPGVDTLPDQNSNDVPGPPVTNPPVSLPPLPSLGEKNRFRGARTAFNRAIRSGNVRENLGRALSRYSKGGMGGSGTAARRLSNSSQSAGRILDFAQEIRDVGFAQAADDFGIGDLTERPLGEAVARLTDAFSDPGGSIDEAMTRAAWNETLLLAVQQGVEDFEILSAGQWASLVEVFISKSIEFRVFNDIGNDLLGDALNVDQINAIQADLHDLIFGAVNGKLSTTLAGENRLSSAALREAADQTYELAFAYLEALGDE